MPSSSRLSHGLRALGISACLGPASASAQTPAAERPFSLALEASASVASRDAGFFNHTDYGRSALQLARVGVLGSWQPTSRVALLGELRADDFQGVQVFALYLRLRPWPERAFDLQAGRIPPTFGAFARRSYSTDNPLIGYPLGYQYLTSLRPDAVPAHADDLLLMRGRGWASQFPIGVPDFHHGLPLVAASRWDTGVQARVGSRPVSLLVGVTAGTLSNPLVRDDNDGRQIATRLEIMPAAGWTIGASAARGGYLTRETLEALPPGTPAGGDAQRALGADVEYAQGRFLLRAEGILSAWSVPSVPGGLLSDPLEAWALSFEGRYRPLPAWHLAARFDRLWFSRIRGTRFGARPTPWDAPVGRLELGAGYRILRNLTLKAAYQRDWRDSQRNRSLEVAAAQLAFWL